MKNKLKVCCICKEYFEGWGNNPFGAMWRDEKTGKICEPKFNEDDRCCDQCNMYYVIPGRMYKIKMSQKQK